MATILLKKSDDSRLSTSEQRWQQEAEGEKRLSASKWQYWMLYIYSLNYYSQLTSSTMCCVSNQSSYAVMRRKPMYAPRNRTVTPGDASSDMR